MIIIEGMDNTGKTTLAMDVARTFKAEYVHLEKPNSEEEIWDNMKGLLVRKDTPVVDRLHCFSEPVYGLVIRGENRIAPINHVLLRQVINDCCIVYCRPPDEAVFDFGEREQMEGVIDKKVQLLRAYDVVYRKIKGVCVHTISYDYTKEDTRQVYNMINEYLSEKSQILSAYAELAYDIDHFIKKEVK